MFVVMFRPEPCVGVHFHSCPECYEQKLCVEACSRERDLEDDGMQAGSICVCDDCSTWAEPREGE